jgi:hypothetical protein
MRYILNPIGHQKIVDFLTELFEHPPSLECMNELREKAEKDMNEGYRYPNVKEDTVRVAVLYRLYDFHEWFGCDLSKETHFSKVD